MRSISAIRSRYYRLARRLGAPRAYVQFATRPGEAPYIERNGDVYAYVFWERGEEFERRTTADPEEILYWLVSDLTGDMARAYELAHRREGEDSRRQWFAKDVELLASVNPEWGRRKALEYDEILRVHPFVDTQA